MKTIKNCIILPKTADQFLLAEYYSLADIFAICSKRENFPTTCVEAQCCGTPIAGFDTGGSRETSLSEEDSFVAYGEAEKLTEKISTVLWKDAPDIAGKAQKAYSKETMAKHYMEEYDIEGRKERILLVDVNCKGSSTGKIVYDLYKCLRADGRKAAVCYGRGEQLNEEDIYKFGLDWETNIHAALSRLTGYNGCFSPLSTKRLIKYIEDFKPDLIHIHELHAYFVNIKPLINYIKAKKIPLVWTFHCEYMYTGKCGYANNCLNFEKECGNCPAVKDYPKSLIFDRTRQMLRMKKELLADLDFTIVTPSKWLADRVKMSFLRDKPIKVIHNGVDTSIFHPVDASELRKKLNIPVNYKVVLSVAPDIMSERKGGKWILKLAEMMSNEEVIFILIGVGGGKIVIQNALPNVRMFEKIEEQEMLAKYYSMADLCVAVLQLRVSDAVRQRPCFWMQILCLMAI